MTTHSPGICDAREGAGWATGVEEAAAMQAVMWLQGVVSHLMM
jgi:hypothetical protein